MDVDAHGFPISVFIEHLVAEFTNYLTHFSKKFSAWGVWRKKVCPMR
jgi:hypothetical protein